jgi:flagellar protein FliL
MAEDVIETPQNAPARRAPKWLVVAIPLLAVAMGGAVGTRVIGPVVVHRMHAAAAAKAKLAPAAPAGAMHLIENLVLNPAGTGGTRFLMVSVAIETKDAATNDAMNQRDAEVRDVILQLLGSKTVDQLADVTQRGALREELLDRLRTLFPSGAIRQIYFPQFVIQ